MNAERLPSKHVVLLGVGHTNAHVVKMWRDNQIANTSLTCISDNSIATYSGMLPAVLGQQIPPSEMEIDLVRLCSAVGARLIVDDVAGLDIERHEVLFRNRPAVPFDVLSVGIGSVPSMEGVTNDGEFLVTIKPMQTFLQRLRSAIIRIQSDRASAATNRDAGTENSGRLKIVVIGGGVAGIEIVFCLPPFVASVCNVELELELITRSERILESACDSMRQRVAAEISKRNISVVTGQSIQKVSSSTITLADGSVRDADVVIWATGAVPPELLSQLNVPLNDRGFIATNATLQSISGQPVFAVGDTGAIVSEDLPKAGVYAVRQGPILWENVQRILRDQPLTTYVPQQSFLKLLNTGDGRAIGEWKGKSFSGRWVKRLKDRIDGRFMNMFRMLYDMPDSMAQMQCKGCGCKLGSDVLESALASLAVNSSNNGAGQVQMDDAAVVPLSTGGQVVVSTDFFTTPFDDMYLAGRIAALHSASDLIAMGASVRSAVANIVLPEGDAVSQRRALNELLQGALYEFQALNADIVGGHTIVGPRLEVGFTVLGEPLCETLLQKKNLRIGDRLFLTKPLGIGILLAAHMRSQCSARAYDSLIDTMLMRQHTLAAIAGQLGICAGTDVTGFGLAGHLVEMLTASNVAATLDLSNVPLLPGVVDACNAGIESTLAPQNRRVGGKISATSDQQMTAQYQALFDPQTCGGLLLGVSAATVDDFVAAVQNTGLPDPVCIGQVCERNGEKRSIVVE
ncbi:MAG: selenide, water dikinase SelD [Fuerstiella sp.]|nr:selenide, water dikinase SelD [Fuerstiella sp.]